MQCRWVARLSSGLPFVSNSETRWILKAPRRCALARKQRWSIFALMCAIGFFFAFFAGFAFDAWIVMPFTGVELLAVGAAFWWWDSHAEDFEAIIIEGGALKVVRQYGKYGRQCELPAAWAQVSRQQKPSGWGKRRLMVIACKGRAVTFGEFLNEAGVNECQRLLKERLKSAWA